MKTIGKLIVVTTLVVIVFGLPKAAEAENVFRITQQIASASFSSTDPSGCILTDVSVFATEAVVQFPPGQGDSSSNGFVSISQFDNCLGTQMLGATGLTPLADEDFQLSPTLDSATLNASINVNDWVSGTSFDVSVNLTWTSTDPLGRLNSHNHDSLPGCKTNSHSTYAFRPAQASGTISDGATNFTPEVGYGELSSGRAGNVDIGCE